MGDDYYLAYTPGNNILFWHSRDLVNWRPVKRHSLGPDFNTIWASDLVYFDGKFHVYMPLGTYPGKTGQEENHEFFKSVWMISAENIEGPWSEPVRVDNHYNPDPFYTGIDPGFIQTPEGKKYCYVDNGFMFPLNEDGTSSTDKARVVYHGWEYPGDWVVQCKCLESPKLFYREGYYYIVSATGGTSGPATAHMAIVARSKSPEGPWTESPWNPLVHTYSDAEPWWQQGHATILEGPGGQWYTLFPSRPANYTEMGKQTLLLPLEWTEDGWPRVKNQVKPWDLIPMPRAGNVGHGMPLSDDFSGNMPGIQWNIGDIHLDRVRCEGGKLLMEASGEDSRNGTSISVNATNKSFEATVRVKVLPGTHAALVFGNHEGLKNTGEVVRYNLGREWRTRNSDVELEPGQEVWLKIRNVRKDLSFYCSTDGINWTHFQNGARGGEYGVRLCAWGEGEAQFSGFAYQGLEDLE